MSSLKLGAYDIWLCSVIFSVAGNKLAKEDFHIDMVKQFRRIFYALFNQSLLKDL